jgi:hypothetical protein
MIALFIIWLFVLWTTVAWATWHYQDAFHQTPNEMQFLEMHRIERDAGTDS